MTTNKQQMQTLGDLMAGYEEELHAKAKAEIAAEKAAWDALPIEEQERIIAEREAKWAELEANQSEDDEVDEDEDDDEGEVEE